MKDVRYFEGSGCENVGVNVYAPNQTSLKHPVIPYIIFIPACLQMWFEDIYLQQYFRFIRFRIILF